MCQVSKCLTEFAHLCNVFTANEYPDSLVWSTPGRHLPGQPTTTNTISMTVMEGPAPKLLFLPYIAGVTARIERVCCPLGIRAMCGYRSKMREPLVKVKQPTPELDKNGVVYEVSCEECIYVYIGETGRTLRKRLTKHKVAVKKCDNKNGILGTSRTWMQQPIAGSTRVKSGEGLCLCASCNWLLHPAPTSVKMVLTLSNLRWWCFPATK